MHRRDFKLGTSICSGLGTALLLGLGIANAQELQPNWRLPSDGTWQPETVSLGATGSEVFSEYGFYENSRVLLSAHDTNPPTPVWSDGEDMWNHARRVDSSARGNVHAAIHQEFTDESLTWRRPVLRKYSSGSAEADWVYTWDMQISSQDKSDIRVAEDGSRIVAIVYDVSQGATVLTVFNPQSSAPVAMHAINTGGAYEGIEMSSDGKRMVLRSSLKFQVVDLDSGTTLFTKYYVGSFFTGGLDVSGSGDVVAIATGGVLDVYHWNGSSYNGPNSYPLPSGGYTPALALSEDGLTVAHATNFYGSVADVHFQMLNTADLTLVSDHYVSGSGSMPNVASIIQLSADGETAALGLWGDEFGTTPEVLVFNKQQVGIAASCDLPGSIMDMDLSPDGQRIAVAAKGVHATEFGSGGGLYLFETVDPDFDMHGVPSVGSTVTLGQELNPGSFGRVVYAPSLSNDPRVFAGVGTLFLNENQLGFLPGLSMAGADGNAWTSHYIGNDAALIGTTVFFQGIGLRPRKLSENVVRMTILP